MRNTILTVAKEQRKARFKYIHTIIISITGISNHYRLIPESVVFILLEQLLDLQ